MTNRRRANDYRREVRRSDKDSYDLDYSGLALSEHTTKCLYKAEDDFYKSIKKILDEFALYENGTGRVCYEKHWGGFHQVLYHRARKHLHLK